MKREQVALYDRDLTGGIKASTAVMRQAAEAFRAGVPLAEYAKDHAELRAVAG